MEYLQNPLVRGALSGLGAAVLIDVATFMKWKSWDEACQYQYGTAALRWLQGLVGGVVTALGISVAS